MGNASDMVWIFDKRKKACDRYMGRQALFFMLYSFILSISVRFTPATWRMAFKERYSSFNLA